MYRPSERDSGESHPGESHFTTSDARGFEGVDTWVFDLDNTLYPSDAQVWPQVDERITLYVMRLYGLDGMSARALQKYFYHRYGTTLKALMIEDHVDPHEFLDFAHDIDHSTIRLDAALGDAIEALPGRKLILTNGSRRHAEDVARKLGILDHFEDVFDIASADFVPKPERSTYERFLSMHGVDPKRAALFEDIARNLVVPHDLGMATVLVVPPVIDPFRESFEQEAVREPHIDHITTDLAAFLRSCVLPIVDAAPVAGEMTGAWSRAHAPSLADIETLALAAFAALPETFRSLCADVRIHVDDFPDEATLAEMACETEFDLLGLFRGVGLAQSGEVATGQMPNAVWLYRRPLLDYWAEHDETLGHLVTHVLVHEIGHHLGLSDRDMAAIEAAADATDA